MARWPWRWYSSPRPRMQSRWEMKLLMKIHRLAWVKRMWTPIEISWMTLKSAWGGKRSTDLRASSGRSDKSGKRYRKRKQRHVRYAHRTNRCKRNSGGLKTGKWWRPRVSVKLELGRSRFLRLHRPLLFPTYRSHTVHAMVHALVLYPPSLKTKTNQDGSAISERTLLRIVNNQLWRWQQKESPLVRHINLASIGETIEIVRKVTQRSKRLLTIDLPP